MQAKMANDSLSLNQITFTQKTKFLLDPLWSCGGGFPIWSRDKLYDKIQPSTVLGRPWKKKGHVQRTHGTENSQY